MSSSNGHLTDKKVDEKIASIDGILAPVKERFFKGRGRTRDGVPIDYRTPLDELAELEEGAQADLAAEVAELEKIPRDKAFQVFRDYEAGLMNWLFAAGPNPLEVIRRLFAYAKMRDARLLWNMGFRDIGPLLGESHGAAQWRCRILFGDLPAGAKKGSQAVAKMRDAQRGNNNRKCASKKSQKRAAEVASRIASKRTLAD